MNVKGVFITLEGIDFCGKSTQAEMLHSRLLQLRRQEPILLREPGGTRLSDRIRDLLLDPKEHDTTDRAELLLFLASRAQLVERVIKPSIHQGRIVICDRFYDSTFAYQGFARGLPLDIVMKMNSFATDGLIPDLTLLYDLPVEIARQRGRGQVPEHDRMEKEDNSFHQSVREGYLKLAEKESGRIKVIPADPAPVEVFERTWEFASRCLAEHGIEIERE